MFTYSVSRESNGGMKGKFLSLVTEDKDTCNGDLNCVGGCFTYAQINVPISFARE